MPSMVFLQSRAPTPLRGRTPVVAALLAAILATGASAEVASPPIDGTLYRQGEVRHLQGTFGRWVVACDEVIRLRQRYCSLRTRAENADKATTALLTVSTGDDGRPAALVEIPSGVMLAAGVKVSIGAAETPQRKKSQRAATRGKARVVPLAQCDGNGCYAVWTFSKAELAALNGGKPLHLAYEQLRTLEPLQFELGRQRGRLVEAEILTKDFAAAVTASINAN